MSYYKNDNCLIERGDTSPDRFVGDDEDIEELYMKCEHS